jgi:hypothetical protein
MPDIDMSCMSCCEGGGIITECSGPDTPISPNLTATFTDFPGACACLNGLEVDLIYDPGEMTPTWIGDFTNGCDGGTSRLTLTCVLFAWHIVIDQLTPPGCQSSGSDHTSATYEPTVITFTGVPVSTCCVPGENATITITDTA